MNPARNSGSEDDVKRKKNSKVLLQMMDYDTERLMIPPTKKLSESESRIHVKKTISQKEVRQREVPNNSPSSLFIIVLSFISKNIHHVESLKGYPEYFGKILFQAAILLKKFSLSYYPPQSKCISYNLQLFLSAYKEQVLSSLSICNGLITINEYLMPLMLLTRFVTELQLTGCHLGDNHELIDHVKHLKCLRRLGLKDNCLSNEAIRKLSLPFRVMGKGTSHLQEIDISCNPSITKKAVFWLSLFINLKMINIACTGINEENLKLIRDKYGFTRMNIDFNPIKTVGWAENLIKSWIEEAERSIKREESTTRNGFFSVRRRPYCSPYCSHHSSDHAEQLIIVRPGPF